VEFGLLGPLVVTLDGQRVRIASAGQRVVLAALLLRANHVVSVDHLIDDLWPDVPPPTARATLQNYVMRLRRTLGPVQAARIVTQPPGYLIEAAPAELDLTRFTELSTSGQEAAKNGHWENAAEQLGAALSLWRGRPFVDVPSDRLTLSEEPRLEETRLQCLEARLEADLHLGRHASVVGELLGLVQQEPLRDRLHASLMLALYRSGQQAAALVAYQQARQTLIEMGIEPGLELRRLHARILRSDPSLEAPSARAGQRPSQSTGGNPAHNGSAGRTQHQAAAPQSAETAGTTEATETARTTGTAGTTGTAEATGATGLLRQSSEVIPRQLPTAARHFTGRKTELEALGAALLDDRPGEMATVPIVVITGPAGVGKTTLAVTWAHQAAERFPDGQLFINLRGFHPSDEPLTCAQSIREFLDALQIPAERIPPDLEARATLLRSVLAGKRILMVLDNARDVAQVRPLLPGTAGCAVLITSRSQLTGLVAAEGAGVVPIPVMTSHEARELLARILGPARVAAEENSAEELAALCARLPLALSIAAARAASEPHLTLAGFCAAMRSAATRLDVLDTGDPASSARTIFSWSYQALSEPAARMFRLLCLHPGSDLSARAAASLAAVPVPQALKQLDELTRHHMLDQVTPGRYAFHDLLRAYAAEQAAARDGHAARQAAIHRVLDYYLHACHDAALLLSPTREPITPAEPQPGVAQVSFGGQGEALVWLEAERPVLLAAVTQASETGFDVHAWQLPLTLATYLSLRGHWLDWVATQHTAVTAARRIGDKAGQARAERGLGRAYERLCWYQDSFAHLQEALELYRQLGDIGGQADVHLTSARLLEVQGDHAESLSHAEQSLRQFRLAGHEAGHADALNAVGWQHAQLGHYELALAHCQQALSLCRELGSRHGEAATLDSLGYSHHHLGHYADAIACQRQALSLLGELGHQPNRAEVLVHLGDTHQAAGQPTAARDAFEQALAILDDLQHPGADQVRAKLRAADLAARSDTHAQGDDG
jgi:DNA-binding SARP family transcriptional activator/tetratricopeptide (TPR) repeat protein